MTNTQFALPAELKSPLMNPLKRLKAKYDLTLEEIATGLGKGVDAVRRWYRGENLPPTASVEKIADLLNEPTDLVFAQLHILRAGWYLTPPEKRRMRAERHVRGSIRRASHPLHNIAAVLGVETQRDIAEKLGITESTLSGYLTGKTVPPPTILSSMAEKLGMKPSALNELFEKASDEAIKAKRQKAAAKLRSFEESQKPKGQKDQGVLL